jgi:hypothetical protein
MELKIPKQCGLATLSDYSTLRFKKSEVKNIQTVKVLPWIKHGKKGQMS